MLKNLYKIFGLVFLLSSFLAPISSEEARSILVVNPKISQTLKTDSNSFENKYTKLAKKLTPTVVFIGVKFIEYDVLAEKLVERHINGSGVFISKNGHVLTCSHLFTNPNIQHVVIITKDRDMLTAEVLYVDHVKDLALLKPRYDLEKVNYTTVTTRSMVDVGEEVIAIGYPLGLGMNFTNGIVTNNSTFIRPNQEVIWTNAVINLGNSGGPLFDIEGNLIGINAMMVTSNIFGGWAGNSFAVSPKEVNNFLNKFRGL